jgi:hypothetical protein
MTPAPSLLSFHEDLTTAPAIHFFINSLVIERHQCHGCFSFGDIRPGPTPSQISSLLSFSCHLYVTVEVKFSSNLEKCNLISPFLSRLAETSWRTLSVTWRRGTATTTPHTASTSWRSTGRAPAVLQPFDL